MPAQHPEAILRKCGVVTREVITVLQQQLPTLLPALVNPEGVRQIEKGCEMIHQYIQREGNLSKIKLRLKADKRCLHKVLFSSDCVVVVLKTEDYNGRKGTTVFVEADKGLCDKQGRVLVPVEQLIPEESIDNFDAALEGAFSELYEDTNYERGQEHIGLLPTRNSGGARKGRYEGLERFSNNNQKNKTDNNRSTTGPATAVSAPTATSTSTAPSTKAKNSENELVEPLDKSISVPKAEGDYNASTAATVTAPPSKSQKQAVIIRDDEFTDSSDSGEEESSDDEGEDGVFAY